MGDGLNAQLAFGTAGSADKPLRSFESFNNGARQSALTESEMRSKLSIKGDENGNDTKPVTHLERLKHLERLERLFNGTFQDSRIRRYVPSTPKTPGTPGGSHC